MCFYMFLLDNYLKQVHTGIKSSAMFLSESKIHKKKVLKSSSKSQVNYWTGKWF